MATKLIAAELATAAGVTTVIMRSSNVDEVMKIVEAADDADEDDIPLCTRFVRRENRLAEWVAEFDSSVVSSDG